MAGKAAGGGKEANYEFVTFIPPGCDVAQGPSMFDTDEWIKTLKHLYYNGLVRRETNQILHNLVWISKLVKDVHAATGLVRILDIGGGVGQVLPDLLVRMNRDDWGRVAYTVVDSVRSQDEFLALCKEPFVELSDPGGRTMRFDSPLGTVQAKFVTDHTSIDRSEKYDFVICSSVLHYIDDDASFLEFVASLDFKYFCLLRVPCSETGPFGGIQTTPVGPVRVWIDTKAAIVSGVTRHGHTLAAELPRSFHAIRYPADWPPHHRNVVEHHFVFEGRSAHPGS